MPNPPQDVEEAAPSEAIPPQDAEEAAPSDTTLGINALDVPASTEEYIVTVGAAGSGATYPTVQAAVSNAVSGPPTIQLITDISEGSVQIKGDIFGDRKITLDLNGNKWTDTSADNSPFSTIWIKSGSTLTIKDSIGGGMIEKTNNGQCDCHNQIRRCFLHIKRRL